MTDFTGKELEVQRSYLTLIKLQNYGWSWDWSPYQADSKSLQLSGDTGCLLQVFHLLLQAELPSNFPKHQVFFYSLGPWTVPQSGVILNCSPNKHLLNCSSGGHRRPSLCRKLPLATRGNVLFTFITSGSQGMVPKNLTWGPQHQNDFHHNCKSCNRVFAWPPKLKICVIWSHIKKLCWPLLSSSNLSKNNAYISF